MLNRYLSPQFKASLIAISLSLLPVHSNAEPLSYYQMLNHLDNYGNLDLRNKPYTSLQDGLEVEGNLLIARSPIQRLPRGLKIQGSLDASNSALTTVMPGTYIRGYANFLGAP
ncbi:leucine-rich repeat protein [Vibrio astriarenae]|nr:leucine-rich repeat protein [Vibrio sp. C7]